MKINKYTSTHNTTHKKNRAHDYVVMHYTAGTTSKKGKAKDVCKMFSTFDKEASADFIVDDAEIWQYNPDLNNRYTWSVGGSKYKWINTPAGGTYYSKCTNKNSISIEMCSNKKNTKSLNGDDTDWYLTPETMENAAELAAYLLKKYNLGIDRLLMHHHVTGKCCPNPWCVNESRLEEWENFKKKVKQKMKDTNTHKKEEPKKEEPKKEEPKKETKPQKQNNNKCPYLVKVTANDGLNVREGAGTKYKIVTTLKKGDVYTIVEEKDVNGSLWGKLKSGAGWICLKYTQKK